MPPDPLENLAAIGKLKREPPSETEIQGLLQSGLNRLQDAQRSELSLESRFDLAYNAAHALDLSREQWRVLDQAHRKRNLAEYEGHMEADEALVSAMLRVAREIAVRLER